jgi:hypothetical protein
MERSNCGKRPASRRRVIASAPCQADVTALAGGRRALVVQLPLMMMTGRRVHPVLDNLGGVQSHDQPIRGRKT